MTQALGVHERISELDRAPISAPATKAGTATDRLATFAITFGNVHLPPGGWQVGRLDARGE